VVAGDSAAKPVEVDRQSPASAAGPAQVVQQLPTPVADSAPIREPATPVPAPEPMRTPVQPPPATIRPVESCGGSVAQPRGPVATPQRTRPRAVTSLRSSLRRTFRRFRAVFRSGGSR
jgi:hypothetical protein